MAVRQRKGKDKPSYAVSNATKRTPKNQPLNFVLIIGGFLGAIACSFGWSYYTTIQAYTPLSSPKAVELIRDHDEDLRRLWGTYRYIYIYVVTAIWQCFVCIWYL